MVQLILDTNLIIESERYGVPLPLVGPDDEVSIAAVTLAELEQGLLAAQTEQVAFERRTFLDNFLSFAEVLPYTEKTAVEHAYLLRNSRAFGKVRGYHDLIIAAHARETGRILATKDRQARFADLPGVAVRQPDNY